MDSTRAVFQRTAHVADHYIEAITAAVEHSRRPRTRRAYARAWERFRRWAEGEALQPLPADPVTVAAYMTHRAELGLSAATLAMDRKAISHHHRNHGYSTPTASEGVKLTIAGLRNQAAEEGRGEPRQARGLNADVLAAIRATAHVPRTGPTGRKETVETARSRGEMDIAIASVMRDALLRRGEAAELRWGAVEFRRGRFGPGHDPTFQDEQHLGRPVRGAAGDRGSSPDPSRAGQPARPCVRTSLRALHIEPNCRDDQGRRSRRGIQRALSEDRHGPGSDGRRSGGCPRSWSPGGGSPRGCRRTTAGEKPRDGVPWRSTTQRDRPRPGEPDGGDPLLSRLSIEPVG